MTPRDRDSAGRFEESKEGPDRATTAAEEIGQSERHARRLLKRLKGQRLRDAGACATRAAIQPQFGRETNAPEILRRDVYRDFGPTLAAEYLGSKHDIPAECETSDIRVFPVPHSAITAARPFLSHFLGTIDCAARLS
jgi:hypothetical protein